MKKIARTERKTNISFNKKNLDWSKFFCRQDLKQGIAVRLSIRVHFTSFCGELRNKNFSLFFLGSKECKTSISFEMFLSKN